MKGWTLSLNVVLVLLAAIHYTHAGISHHRSSLGKLKSLTWPSALIERSERFKIADDQSCSDCKNLIATVAGQASKLKWPRQEIIMQTQILGQQLNSCDSINLMCSSFTDVTKWLRKAGLIADSPINLAPLATNPVPACHNVELCVNEADPSIDFTKLQPLPTLPPVPQPTPPTSPNLGGGVIVRLKIKSAIATIDRTSARWEAFTSKFVNDTAGYLQVTPDRLDFHMGQGDDSANLEIKPSQNVSSLPLDLAKKLKAALSPDSTVEDVPPYLVNVVDENTKAEIFPSVIPKAVPPADVKPMEIPRNLTAMYDCTYLQKESQAACGANFRCEENCRRQFRLYYGRCITQQMPQKQYKILYGEYLLFFHRCDKCNENRDRMVRENCSMTSTTEDFPPKCSLFCSQHYTPYYEECLTFAASSWPVVKRQNMDKFYKSCGACSLLEAKRVHASCDTRMGIQLYYYPPTCSQLCAANFTAFYDSCLEGETKEVEGITAGSYAFRLRCQSAIDGGVYIRLALRQDISSVVHVEEFKIAFAAEIARVLAIPKSRVEVYKVDLVSGAKTFTIDVADNTTKEHRDSDKFFVDLVIKVGASQIELDPVTLADQLRQKIERPNSLIYNMPLCSNLDITEGLKYLLPHTSQVGKALTPSSLELAKAELEKGLDQGAPADVIQMLHAMVQYHKALDLGSRPTLIAVRLANAGLQAARAHKAAPKIVDYLEARLRLAQARDQNAKPQVIAEEEAYVDYMGAVAKGDTTAMVEKQYANYQYQGAIADGKDQDTLNAQYAKLQYYTDMASSSDQGLLSYDRANMEYMGAVLDKASPEVLSMHEADVDYGKKLSAHAHEDTLATAKALLDYRRAIVANASPLELQYREADYNAKKAVEAKSSPESIKQLVDLADSLQKQLASAKPETPSETLAPSG